MTTRSEYCQKINQERAGFFRPGWRLHVPALTIGRIILAVLLLVSAAATATSGRITFGADQADLTDTVVLYDRIQRNSDVDFRKVSEYYGLQPSTLDISTQLRDAHFRDAQGNAFQAAYVDATTLAGMTSANLAVLRSAVTSGGIKLLITEVTQSSFEVSYLTSGEVTGAQAPAARGTRLFISNADPEVSRQFSGQTVDTQTNANDFGLTMAPGATRTTVLISGGSFVTSTYPIFARYREGSGEIFVQSTTLNFNLEQTRLADSYYAFRAQGAPVEKFQDFSRAVPMMMFVRYAAGDEAWHSDRQFAGLMVDDPPLTQPFSGPYTNSFYTDLLANMKSHKFTTSMAFVPYNSQTTQPDVAQLFRDNPGYYSLIVHGDRHTCPEMPASAGADGLKATALDALSRMSQLQQTTGIPFGKQMVFPCGQYDLQSLTALKQTGFDSTVNAGTVPGNATKPADFDYGMYQADLDFSNFASIPRLDVELSTPLHELFIGRPLLVFTHPAFFQKGLDAFNTWADSFNAITGGIEWRSLDYIVKRLYLEKLNDDQSVSVMFYTRNVFVQNSYPTTKSFHFSKKETLDAPIAMVTINGASTLFKANGQKLEFDAQVPSGQEVEIALYYAGDPSPVPLPRQFLPFVGKNATS